MKLKFMKINDQTTALRDRSNRHKLSLSDLIFRRKPNQNKTKRNLIKQNKTKQSDHPAPYTMYLFQHISVLKPSPLNRGSSGKFCCEPAHASFSSGKLVRALKYQHQSMHPTSSLKDHRPSRLW